MSVPAAERRVLVLGSANMDLVVRQPRLPSPGETMFGESFTTVPGGKGLNQAVAAARAGATVAFVGAVGDDGHGRSLVDLLGAEGIDTAGLENIVGATGTAHISVLDSGENAIEVFTEHTGVIDLIISDVMMPGINGPKMIESLYEQFAERMKPIEVVFISGYAEDAFVDTYGQDRTFNFLPKPFTLKQLASKVKDVLDQKATA